MSSVKLEENSYKKLRECDSSWQSMTRMTDVNNIFDVRQEFVKNSTKNDFESELDKFEQNKGLLSNGVFINKQDFFTITSVDSNSKLTSKPVKYFKFKANVVLDFRNKAMIPDTYIDKTHYSSIYALEASTTDSKTTYTFGDKAIEEETLSSYPLQRVDKLTDNELTSMFLYINGIKIPDNEIFVFAGRSWTDILVPMSYIGNIESSSFYTDVLFNIDVRKSGTESFYYRNESLSGNSVTIDMSADDYFYSSFSQKTQTVTKDKIVMFVDGKIKTIKDVNYVENTDKKSITIDFNEYLSAANVEIYVLNDIVDRYKIPETSMLNPNGSKVHFYLNDDYITDTLCGPITKSAVSFFYDGVRMDDTKIVQTSRFSFEYQIDRYIYTIVADIKTTSPLSKVTYYEQISDGTYIVSDVTAGFNSSKTYYTRKASETFDESKMDFFIEDINDLVGDSQFRLYGDDYYLLNMLGVKRCVDKMKGDLSYSIFDDSKYSIGFKGVLSKDGTQFDVPTVKSYYNNLEENYHTDGSRIEQMIKDKPSICRDLFKQFKRPSKKFIVLGNEKDVSMSSIEKVSDDANIYYKIYVNHVLLESSDYTTTRVNGIDLITVGKSVLNPLVKDSNGNITSGINRIELFQYDLTYSSKLIIDGNVNDTGFTSSTSTEDGIKYYYKTYNIADLPFGDEFLDDDIAAIEPVEKSWFTKDDDEYYLVYPNLTDNKGFRAVKSFEITNHGTSTITIKIALNDYTHTTGDFYLLCKNFNIVKSIYITNEDTTYMQENDLVYPIYSSYVTYTTDTSGNKVVDKLVDYIPYINNSEPFLTKNGKELVYGKDYTFITPDDNNAIACSFLVMKSQLDANDVIVLQFNSAKTNILILGYNDLSIENKYGLIYMSELKYPVDTEYMNIIVNGEKVSSMDVDILSDKLIRVHNIYRPITSLVVTTNLLYKESEIQNFINCYRPSEFELLLAKIFRNCDPSYEIDTDYPAIDSVYKVISTSSDYETNHGFDINVDSVQQAENPYKDESDDVYNSDTIVIMYINWLCHSKKTRAYGFKTENINPTVLKYFSIYSNTVVDNRIDMFVDASRYYDGVYEDINSEPIKYEIDNTDNTILHRTYQYPGAQIDLRRRFFYSMLMDILDENSTERLGWDEENKQDDLVKELCDHEGSRVLYPDDYPLDPDRNGIRWTGSNTDIVAY